MADELPRGLIVLTKTQQLLSEAKTVQDLKAIRNKAEAARNYAKSAQLGLEIQISAAEVKLECERRAGSMIREIELSLGGRPGRKNRSHVATGLEDLGINKSQSSRWQQEADLPEEDFQRYLADSRAGHREPTSQGVLRLVRKQRDSQYYRTDPPARSRRSKRSSKRLVLNTGIGSGPALTLDEQDVLIADLQDHHRQLSQILAAYCDAKRLDKSERTQRRYVARLLSEMGELLTAVRNLRR